MNPTIPAAPDRPATAKRRDPSAITTATPANPLVHARTTRFDIQGAHEVATRKQPDPTTSALRSLLGIEALALLTSIHHLEEFGVSFLLPAVLLVSLPLVLTWWVLKQPSRAARLSYVTLLTLVIVGFGVLDGLWNHTVKMVVFFLRGADRANMAGLPFPPVGSVFHEVTGPLPFVAAIFAAYFGYQFITGAGGLRSATPTRGRPETASR
jgi:hypothetical protein